MSSRKKKTDEVVSATKKWDHVKRSQYLRVGKGEVTYPSIFRE